MTHTGGDKFVENVVALFFIAIILSTILQITGIDQAISIVVTIIICGMPLVVTLKNELRRQEKQQLLSACGLIIPLGLILGLYLYFSRNTYKSS